MCTLTQILSIMAAFVHAGLCLSQCLINALVEPAPRRVLERHPLTFTARGQRCSLTHLLFSMVFHFSLSSSHLIFSCLLLLLLPSSLSFYMWLIILFLFLPPVNNMTSLISIPHHYLLSSISPSVCFCFMVTKLVITDLVHSLLHKYLGLENMESIANCKICDNWRERLYIPCIV